MKVIRRSFQYSQNANRCNKRESGFRNVQVQNLFRKGKRKRVKVSFLFFLGWNNQREFWELKDGRLFCNKRKGFKSIQSNNSLAREEKKSKILTAQDNELWILLSLTKAGSHSLIFIRSNFTQGFQYIPVCVGFCMPLSHRLCWIFDRYATQLKAFQIKIIKNNRRDIYRRPIMITSSQGNGDKICTHHCYFINFLYSMPTKFASALLLYYFFVQCLFLK